MISEYRLNCSFLELFEMWFVSKLFSEFYLCSFAQVILRACVSSVLCLLTGRRHFYVDLA